jgi:O-antigen ligase
MNEFGAIGNKKIKEYAAIVSALILFIIAGAIFMGPKIVFVLAAITIVFLAIIVSITQIHFLFLLSFFCLPFSINVNLFDSGINLITPSEPLAALGVIAFIIKVLTNNPIPKTIGKHPITWIIMGYMIVLVLATINSSMPMVSIKATLVKLCYILFYFFAGATFITQDFKLTKKAFLLYGLSLLGIIFYALFNHYNLQFSKDTSGVIANPFYSDHTIYSACISFIIPFVLYELMEAKRNNVKIEISTLLYTVSTIFIISLFFSYCRAAWLSIIFSLLIFSLIYVGVKPRFFLILMGITLLFLSFNASDILLTMKQNKFDSNAKNAGLEQQTKSVTNITTDQSNAERVNRWLCASRMFNERPWFGFGPGTYQFQYFAFQRTKEMSRISVVTPYNHKLGRGGTAHSEPLLALSESGIISFLMMSFLLVVVIYIAIKNFQKKATYSVYSLILLTALSSYLVHSFFNNFLDTDKVAGLFWFTIAAIMIIDIKQKEIENSATEA